MEREGDIIGGVFSQGPENVEINRDEIVSQIKELSSRCGGGPSDYELHIAVNGPEKGNQESYNTSFRLGERAAVLQDRADHGISEQEIRDCGSQSLLWRAASYLEGAPEYAIKCVDLARRVLNDEIEWGGFDIPDANKALMDEEFVREKQYREERAEKSRKKAA